MIFNAVRLTVGDLILEGLRVEFDISATIGSYDKAVLKVHNMKEASYNALRYDALAIVEVLGESGWEQLYAGNFRLRQRKAENGGTVTTLNLFSSLLTYKDKISISMAEGSAGSDVIALFKSLMPTLDFVISDKAQAIIDELEYKGGYSTQVKPTNQLLIDFIKHEVGDEYTPHITSTKVSIGESNKSPIEVNQRTGMIGTPDFFKKVERGQREKDGEQAEASFAGKAVIRLKPSLDLYDKIDIQSKYLSILNEQLFSKGEALTQKQYESVTTPGSGIYQVYKINHQGDTHGDIWQTKIDFRESL
ncbi:TPA: hypothetical protein VGT17_005221 [Vibrio harveyi]|nr:hypothetical protein [Vibrio harveyi]HEQ3599253.1 hypothetical protein [Vibrio harveyi]HEQ3611311.1 hypothetical protein [Vibrio harveyi]